MAEKILNTRIQLKYDTWANWQAIKDTFFPKRGEICLVELPSTPDGQTVPTNPPTVLFKVGTWDGTDATKKSFAQLDWVSAKAADVHSWAKKSEEEFKNWVKTLSIYKEGDGIIITTKIIDGKTQNTISLGIGGGLCFVEDPAFEPQGNGMVVAHKAKPQKNDVDNEKTNTAAARTYITEIEVDAYGHIANVTTAKETIEHIEGKNVVGATASATTNAVATNGNVHLNHVENNAVKSANKIVGAGTTTVTSDANGVITITSTDTNTDNAHTHSTKEKSGIKANGAGGLTGDTTFELNVAFDTYTKETDKKTYIRLYDKSDASKTSLAELDATDFIKDGMIKSVELVDKDASNNPGKFLKITWNIDDAVSVDEDDALDVVYVNVSDLVDVYTGDKGITVENYVIKHTNEIDKKDAFELTSKALSHGDTFDVVEEKYDAQGHITGKQKVTYTLPEATDISGKMDLVSDATAGHYAIFGENGQVIDGGYIDADLSVNDTFGSDENRPGVLGFNVYEKQTVDGVYEENPVIGYYLEVEQDSGLDLYGTSASTTDGSSANNKSRVAMGKLALSEAAKESLAKADSALQEITTIDTSADHTHGTETNCGGLKVTQNKDKKGDVIPGSVNIEIDDSITFIFNCGSATENI